MAHISKYDIQALALATRVAHKGNMRHRHGAVIYRKAKILSSGFNKEHPWGEMYYEFPYLHAEYSAILRSRIDVKNYDIAIVRLGQKNSNLLLSKPCKDCMRLLKDNGIRYIVYSTNGNIHKIKIN